MGSPRKPADKPLTPSQAWQPLTPRGVAAFAQATFARLLAAQLVVATLVALSIVWFVSVAWFPVVHDAIRELETTGEIRDAALNFSGVSPTRLAENRHLAFVVDTERTGAAGHVADVEVTFEKGSVAVCGPLGCWREPYRPGYRIQFNRPQLEPAWGAWRGPLLGLTALGTVFFLFAGWWLVAAIYLPLVKLIAFYADRAVTWSGAGRLAAAALLPGALLVALAVVLYGFGVVDLLRFALLYALHLVAGLLFTIVSPFFLPSLGCTKTGRNPFVG